jgi:hypothetical protein
MVSGDGGAAPDRGNRVRFRISATSPFRRTSSPSLSPDARCAHTKHVVALPCSVRLTEIDPFIIRHSSSVVVCSSSLLEYSGLDVDASLSSSSGSDDTVSSNLPSSAASRSEKLTHPF